MNFKETYSLVFYIYRILGMVPYRLIVEESHVVISTPKFEYLWLFVLFALETYILVYGTILCYEYVLVTKVTLYTGLDLLIVTTFRALLVIITVESFLKRDAQVKALQNLLDIDKVFTEKLSVDVNYPKLGRLVKVLFIKWSLIYIVTEAFLIWLTLFEEANSFGIFLLLFVYPLLKLTLNGSRYITFVHLIKHRILLMQQVLKDSNLWIDENNVRRWDGLQQFCDRLVEVPRMVHLWETYQQIYKTTELVNYSFKWSFSINFSIEILAVCAVLFHVLDYILGEPNRFAVLSLISFGLYLFYYVFRVAMLIRVTHCTAQDVSQFAANVHRLCYKSAPEKLYNFVRKC